MSEQGILKTGCTYLKPFKSVDPVKIDAGVITEKEGEILEESWGCR